MPAPQQIPIMPEEPVKGVGLIEIECIDKTRDFAGKARLLEIAIWYPVLPSTPTQKIEFGIWKIKDAARNAPLYTQGKKLPLILFSHGYSGNQWTGTWFAEMAAFLPTQSQIVPFLLSPAR